MKINIINRNKRAGIGDFITLFFATIVIILLLFIAVFGSSFIQLITSQKTGVNSVILFSMDKYMSGYEAGISGVGIDDLNLIKRTSVVLTRNFLIYKLSDGTQVALENPAYEERTVKLNCKNYETSEITFIINVKEIISEYNPEELDKYYLSEAKDACNLGLEYLQSDSSDSFYEQFSDFQIDVIMPEKAEPEAICCYGS